MEEAPAELAQTDALQLLDKQWHRKNTSCYAEARLGSTLDQIHLLMQVYKLAGSAAVFFQKFQQEKVLLHVHCVSLCALPVEHTCFFSLLPAGTKSEPCLAICYLTVLTPEHHPGRPWYLLTGHTEVLKWGRPSSVVLSVWNKRTRPQLYRSHNLSHHSIMQTCWA